MSKHATQNKTSEAHLFPIRTVAKLTGVNAITLRAWERRYGLIEPHRTDTGHRLYSQEDIDRINEVLKLLDRGIPISQTKEVLRQRGEQAAGKSQEQEDAWSGYRRRVIAAITRFDETMLEEIYNEALSLYPVETVTSQLIIPLLRELGKRWASQEGSVAEEHFFGIYLRNKLGSRLHHRAVIAKGKKLLTACLPGEYHEIGLLLFALATQNEGFQAVILGANMPLEELPAAAKRSQSDAIILSGSLNDNFDEKMTEGLSRLCRETKLPVFVGGKISAQRHDAIVGAGAIPLGEDIPLALRQIKSVLKNAD